MTNTPNDKLELFKEQIMKKAEAEKQEILAQTEEMKRTELDKEETKILEGIYTRMQDEISQIRTDNVKKVSREMTAMKKDLYRQREAYLDELLAKAAKVLTDFAGTSEYEAFLDRKLQEVREQYTLDNCTVFLKEEDMKYTGKVKQMLGACEAKADPQIKIGGFRLLNRGIEVDDTLDTALSGQREWFYNHANFNLD